MQWMGQWMQCAVDTVYMHNGHKNAVDTVNAMDTEWSGNAVE